MNRYPVLGDVIAIGRRELVVVLSGKSDASNTCVFHAIKRDDLGKINPKEFLYYISMGIDRVDHRYDPIGLDEITFIEQIKLKSKVEVTYFEK